MKWPPSRVRLGHEGRITVWAVLSALPAVIVALVLLWTGEHSARLRWTLTAAVVLAWLAAVMALRDRVVRALQTIANLLSALREGDFSVRGRPGVPHDALGEALAEVNSLADTLAHQRTGAVEASALLGKVMAEIDVAIFAFDGQQRLRLINRAGERLLGGLAGAAERPLLGSEAGALEMGALLQGPTPRTVEAVFPGGPGQGQWELRRSAFRLGGLPHELVVLTDLRRALREEERLAWQRLVRVLGHEINNSLAPIRSIAGNLQQTLQQPDGERLADWQEDLGRGLAVIERRSEALGRFMTSYARLARLPPPTLAPVEVGSWLRRVVELEKRLPVALRPGPPLTIAGDADQLEQLLINLVGNAVEAALETSAARTAARAAESPGAPAVPGVPGVEVSWRKSRRDVEILVADDGPGLANTNNLFVPFFTTKPAGSGIGLVLSRQIAEAHRGALALENRPNRPGAIARLRLPL